MAKYKVLLRSVAWDNSYTNIVKFDNLPDKVNYFKLDEFINEPVVNFNFGNVINTDIIVNSVNVNFDTLPSANYLVVEENKDNVTNYYFYFINNKEYKSVTQFKLYLEMDVITTFYDKLEFANCEIQRACLNRYTPSGKYDFTKLSPLFENEGIEFSKKPYNITPLDFGFKWKCKRKATNEEFENEITAWLCVYLKNNSSLKCNRYTKDSSGDYYKDDTAVSLIKPYETTYNEDTWQASKSSSGYTVLCAPIYKNDFSTNTDISNVNSNINNSLLHLYIKFGNSLKISNFTTGYLVNFINNNESSVYAIKVSKMPPIPRECYVNVGTEEKPYYKFALDVYGNSTYDLVSLDTNASSETFAIRCTSTVPYDVELHIPSIFKEKYDVDKNPKIFGENCCSLSITNGIDTFDIPLDKFGYADPNSDFIDVKFKYYEPYSPDVTRYFLYPVPKLYSLMAEEDLEKLYYGLIGSIDNSLPFSVNILEQYLSNNKNFYIQRGNTLENKELKMGLQFGSGLLKSAINMGQKNIGGALGNLGGSMFDIGMAKADYDLYAQNSMLTLDNMRSAPEKLQNANGSVPLNYTINHLNFYGYFNAPIRFEIEKFNDYCYKFGFCYGKHGNIKDFANIRSKFNYIQADIIDLYIKQYNKYMGLDSNIKNKIRSIFANGIRLFTKNNNTYDNQVFDFEDNLEL